MFYFRSLEQCNIYKVKSEPFQEGKPYYGTGLTRPLGEVSKTTINAFSLDKLDFAWKDSQVGAAMAWAGVMSTATGLVAFGDNEQNFVMVDAHTGKPLWHFDVGQTIHASPMSYAVDGKQYFAVATGSGDLFAFALP
jgi:alcohol dehydrogenase (cytochrome c)